MLRAFPKCHFEMQHFCIWKWHLDGVDCGYNAILALCISWLKMRLMTQLSLWDLRAFLTKFSYMISLCFWVFLEAFPKVNLVNVSSEYRVGTLGYLLDVCCCCFLFIYLHIRKWTIFYVLEILYQRIGFRDSSSSTNCFWFTS